MKKVFLPLLITLLISVLSSCTKDPLRWSNTTVHLFPEEQKELFVKYGNTHFHVQDNGDEYEIEFAEYKEDGKKYFRLAVTSLYHDFHHLYFNGYNDKLKNGKIDPNKELDLNWKIVNRSVVVKGELLPPPNDYGFYEIFLSQDKEK